MISCSSSFASSTPATSLNVTFTSVSATSLALERPTDSSPPPKPPNPPPRPPPPIIARGEHPDAHEQQWRQDPGQQRAKRPAASVAVPLYSTLCLASWVARSGGTWTVLNSVSPVLHLVRQRATDHVARDRDLLDLAAIQVLLELAVGDHVGPADALTAAVGEQAERRDHHEPGDDQPDRRRKVRFRRRHPYLLAFVPRRGPRLHGPHPIGQQLWRASRTNSSRVGRIGFVRAIALARQVAGQNGQPWFTGFREFGSCPFILHLGNSANTATLSTVDTLISGTGADTIVFHRGGQQRLDRPRGRRRHPDLCQRDQLATVSNTETITGGTGADTVTLGTALTTAMSVDLGTGVQQADPGQRRQHRHRQQRSDPDRRHRRRRHHPRHRYHATARSISAPATTP